MKNIFLFIILILAVSLNAQEDKSVRIRSHEIKLNALMLVLGNPEVDYEYIINDNSAIGIAANVNLDNNKLISYNYMVLPYYRLYVGKYSAAGFFFEINAGVVSEEVSRYDPNSGEVLKEDKVGFGPGVAIGGKFLIKSSIVLEFFGGLGRNFSSDEYGSYAFPRVGVSVGKRF